MYPEEKCPLQFAWDIVPFILVLLNRQVREAGTECPHTHFFLGSSLTTAPSLSRGTTRVKGRVQFREKENIVENRVSN